jgi:hypothetical protein
MEIEAMVCAVGLVLLQYEEECRSRRPPGALLAKLVLM